MPRAPAMLDQFEFVFLFLPAVIFTFDRLAAPRRRMQLLLFASTAFYAVASARFLPLLAASCCLNFALGRRLSAGGKRYLLVIGAAVNLVPLAVWKLAAPGSAPPGLSFFSLTQLAFLVDAAAGRTREDDSLRYGLFVSFFPAIMAGPISRHGALAPELERLETSPAWHARAVARFVCGMFQKCVLADGLAPLADRIFDSKAVFPAGDTLTAVLAFALQIYFDFAGYSNMAIGAAAAFGVELPENFDRPYAATSIADFWRRWHISLSQWLRDYVYLPTAIAAGRLPVLRSSALLTGAAASLLTMTVCGLWHGASVGFVLWGVGHGLLLGAHQVWRELLGACLGVRRRRALDSSWLYAVPSWLLTMACVTALWVPFRARDGDTWQRFALSTKMPHSQPYTEARVVVLAAAALALVPFGRLRIAAPWLRERLEPYLFGWRTRAFAFAIPAYLVLVALMAAFYTTRLDRWLVRAIPIVTDPYGIEYERGDFRSNLLVNEIFQGDERKVIICGSSFSREMGVFRFEREGVRYKSGSIGIVGNSLINALCSAAAIVDTPHLDTIILAVGAVNCGRITSFATFGPQGMATMGRLGFDLPRRPFAELEPVALDALSLLKLAVAYRSEEFFQLHGFLNKVLQLAPRSTAIQELSLTTAARADFEKTLAERVEKTARASTPIADPRNGNDDEFRWKTRGCIESLRPGGDIRRALTALKRLCDERKVRLVLYNTPTAHPTRAPNIYPPGFLPAFNAELKRMSEDLHLEYEDLSDFFPYSGEWLYDFLHCWPEVRQLLHRHLLYTHMGAAR